MNYFSPKFWTIVLCGYAMIFAVLGLGNIFVIRTSYELIAVLTSIFALYIMGFLWVVEWDKEKEPEWIPVNKVIPERGKNKR